MSEITILILTAITFTVLFGYIIERYFVCKNEEDLKRLVEEEIDNENNK